MRTTLSNKALTQTQRTLAPAPLSPLVEALTAKQAARETEHPAPPDYRHELKFTVPIAQTFRITAWLRAHPAAFRRLHPPRQINSLYLDSIDLASYAQNLSGVAERCKLRIRWYGNMQSSDLVVRASSLHSEAQTGSPHHNTPYRNSQHITNGTLEVKRKRGLLGWKEHYPLPHDIDLTNTAWSTLLRTLRGNLDPRPRHALDRSPQPVTIIHYQRSYYASADGVVRVTIDDRLRAYDQRRSPRPNLRYRLPIPDQLVVELKCAAEHRDRLADIAADFPRRTSRCSKYITAVAVATSC